MDAVASSIIKMLLLRTNARAKQKSCRCPTLKFSPPSVTMASVTTKREGLNKASLKRKLGHVPQSLINIYEKGQQLKIANASKHWIQEPWSQRGSFACRGDLKRSKQGVTTCLWGGVVHSCEIVWTVWQPRLCLRRSCRFFLYPEADGNIKPNVGLV